MLNNLSSFLISLIKKTRKVIGFFVLAVFLILTIGVVTGHAQNINQPLNKYSTAELSDIIVNLEKTWEGQYEEYFGEDFFNRLETADNISEKFSTMKQLTGKRAAIIWLLPQKKQLQLILLTEGHEPIGKTIKEANLQSLSKTISEFTQGLNIVSTEGENNGDAYLKPAQQLYKWFIDPVEAKLQLDNVDLLVFCVGNKLRSIPFSALHDGNNFLIEKYSVVMVPAYNLTDFDYTDIRNGEVLAMGASKFADQPPLPGVAVELNTIVPNPEEWVVLNGDEKNVAVKLNTILPNPWHGDVFLNQDFTLENLQQQRRKKPYKIIHLATHAEFVSGSPQNSYIQFENSRLTLDQMRQLGWNDPLVELLVLSACKTAIGDEDAELGFAGLAIQSGVKSAIASLWYVSDAGTLALMSEFYQRLKQTPIKADALREAQLAMLRGDVRLAGGVLRSSRGSITLPPDLAGQGVVSLAHPYHWAAFSLIGSPW
jgi:CHAT domain-containing protein